jgi:hypothetical protein
MRRCVNCLNSANRNVRVDLRCSDVLVAEYLLKAANVRSVLVHQRGHAVAEQMTGTALPKLGSGNVLPRNPRQMAGGPRKLLLLAWGR